MSGFMSFEEFNENSNRGSGVEWVSAQPENSTVKYVVLSAINPANVPNFEEGDEQCLIARGWFPYVGNANIVDAEGNKQIFINLPILDSESHSDESEHPFINLVDALGINGENEKTKLRNKYYLWVAPTDEDEVIPMIMDAKWGVIEFLLNFEKEVGDIRGKEIAIVRSDKGQGKRKKTTYSAFPTGQSVDLSDVELDSILTHIPNNTVDKQVKYVHSIRDSLMEYLDLSESQFPLDEDGMVKQEFVEKFGE